MTRIKNAVEYSRLDSALSDFQLNNYALHGILDPLSKKHWIMQILDSERRIEFLNSISHTIRDRSLATPYSGVFNAFKGVGALQNNGQIEEAYWLTFLASHCGKHINDGWNLTEDLYGALGQGNTWTWNSVKNNPTVMKDWIADNQENLSGGVRSRKFGNHRRYTTLKDTGTGTGAAIVSYVNWIMSSGGHVNKIRSIQDMVGQNPKDVFAELTIQVRQHVITFARLGAFDLLCNLSNLRVAPIIVDRSYIEDATGPKSGARCLFEDAAALSSAELEEKTMELGQYLNISPQVMEDSLCNWQKDPSVYEYFRG